MVDHWLSDLARYEILKNRSRKRNGAIFGGNTRSVVVYLSNAEWTHKYL